jgi:hypothetical protein
MKNIVLILAVLFLSASYSVKVQAQTEAQKVELCSKMAGKDASYLKDFTADLPATKSNEKTQSYKFSLLLQKSTRYRITICTDDDSPGRGYVQLFDKEKMLGSSYNPQTGKEYKSFEFDCQKADAYHFFVQFVDGKAGKAIVILSYVKRL